MYYGITDLTTFLLGTMLIVLLPGPNSLYVFTVASQQGIRMGYRGACGIFVGDTILMLLTAAGMASLLKSEPTLFLALQYAGAAYLAYLGYLLIKGAWQKLQLKNSSNLSFSKINKPAAQDDERALHPFKVALTISLLNPKAILFFVSFFIQFVSPSYANPALSFFILGVIVQVCSFIYLSCLIFSGKYLASLFYRHTMWGAGCMGCVGLMFIGIGIKMTTQAMP